MCKIHLGLFKRKSKHINADESNASVSKFQESKSRSNRMSLPKNYCMSAASVSLTPGASLANFPNHYAILQLDQWATTEEVKVQYRKLRAEYFTTNAEKYRQLQSAYAVLVDWEARREYDVVYRVWMGIPPFENGNLEMAAVVKAAVSRIDAQIEPFQEEKNRVEMCKFEEQRRLEEEQKRLAEEEQRLREEEEQRCREADTNWGLKHFAAQYSPLLGSEPYHSYVPVAKGYTHGDSKPKSRRPTYVGRIAGNATP